MKPTDVMLDLETLGVSTRAPIISMAAVTFDRHTGEVFDRFYVRTSPNLSKYQADLGTVEFWLKQSDAARLAVRDTPRPMAAALDDLTYFFGQFADANARVWALPVSFDLPIVENAYWVESSGKASVPWRYDAGRDLRTLFDLAQIGKTQRVQALIPHDALSDCEAQVATLKLAFDILKA